MPTTGRMDKGRSQLRFILSRTPWLMARNRRHTFHLIVSYVHAAASRYAKRAPQMAAERPFLDQSDASSSSDRGTGRLAIATCDLLSRRSRIGLARRINPGSRPNGLNVPAQSLEGLGHMSNVLDGDVEPNEVS